MNTTTVATTRDGSSTRRIEETDDGMIIIEESGNEIQEQDWVDRHRMATFSSDQGTGVFRREMIIDYNL